MKQVKDNMKTADVLTNMRYLRFEKGVRAQINNLQLIVNRGHAENRTEKMKMLCGVVLLIGRLAIGGYWFDRSFIHPTSEDSTRIHRIADGDSLVADNRKIFLLAAVVSFAIGSGLIAKARK